MPKTSAQVTAAEISRLAGVTRATVSNWRRRHADFPAPTGGTDTSPLYDLEAVRAWLAARGQRSAASPAEEFRTVLRLHAHGDTATRLLPLVLAAAHRDKTELTALGELTDRELAVRAHKAVSGLSDVVPDADAVRYTPADAPLLRALLHCVRDGSAQAALDVLAERELEDSAASGAYRTPRPLADLMARLLAPSSGDYPKRVLDPACGSGSLLAAAARHGATHLYGQDSHPVQAQRSAVRLRLDAAGPEVTVRAGDTLRANAFPDLAVDAVVSNPPYGVRDWGHDELAYDPRWAYGVPPRAESELAWVQHALFHLAPGAFAVLLLPPATASRTSGRRVRAELVRAGALRAVIGLPPGASTPLHIGLHLWILQRPEPDGTDRPTVLFIDATGDQRTASPLRTGRSALDWETLTGTVLTHWQAFTRRPDDVVEAPGIARTVPVIELLDELVDLTPTRHVRTTAATADPAAAAQRATEADQQLAESIASLAKTHAPLTWQPAGEEARSWRTATVADLARGGAITLHRAARAPQATEPLEEAAGRSVLTAHDVSSGTRASGDPAQQHLTSTLVIEEGDILLPGILHAGRAVAPRVADREDAGSLLGAHLHLFRPDPDRLDSWFLAGFLSAEDNVAAAATGSTTIHLDPRRLRVPLLPLTEQRRYGAAFRRLSVLRTTARQTAQLAAQTVDQLTTGLVSGALLPPPGTDSA